MLRRVALLAAAVGGSCGRGPVAAATLPPRRRLCRRRSCPVRATSSARSATPSPCARITTTRCSRVVTSPGLPTMRPRGLHSPRSRGGSRCSGSTARCTARWSLRLNGRPPIRAASPVTIRVCGASGPAAIACPVASGVAGPTVAPPAIAESRLPSTRSPPTPPQDAFTEPVKVCVADGTLIGDLDGDGAAEAFPLEGFRALAAVDGAPAAGPSCAEPRFAWFRMPVGPDVIDVLGAVDLDHDGPVELLVAHTAAGGPRTVTLYAPAPGRPPSPRPSCFGRTLIASGTPRRALS